MQEAGQQRGTEEAKDSKLGQGNLDIVNTDDPKEPKQLDKLVDARLKQVPH
jgi:hypothetical protein